MSITSLTREQQHAIRDWYNQLANYVDEHITFGCVEYEQLAPVAAVIKKVRLTTYEPNQADLVVLWNVIQKAQRNHCGPPLYKEDRQNIFHMWSTLDNFFVQTTIESAKAAPKVAEKEGDHGKENNNTEEELKHQVDYGKENNNTEEELKHQVDYGKEDNNTESSDSTSDRSCDAFSTTADPSNEMELLTELIQKLHTRNQTQKNSELNEVESVKEEDHFDDQTDIESSN